MNRGNNNYSVNEILIAVTAIILFSALFLITKLYLSPPLVFAVTVILLYPFRKNKLIKIFYYLSIIIFIIWFFDSLSQILLPFIISFTIAYILNPLTEKLVARNIPRIWSSLIVILSFLICIILIMIFLAPEIVNQFTLMINSLPQAVNDIETWIEFSLIPFLTSLGIASQDLQNKLLEQVPLKLETLLNTFLGSLSGIFTGITAILTQLVNLILIPFLTFYILKDFDGLKTLVKTMLPVDNRNNIIYYYHKFDEIIGSYIRGSLFASLIHGVGVFIFLYLLNIKFAVFLGAVSALLNLIPYFGLLVSIILTAIVALFSGNPGLQIPLATLIYLLQNLLETSYITPKVVGERIGLHPAVLILSLMVFAYFFGFVGLLLALPVTSILIMFFKEWLEKRESNLPKSVSD